MIRAPNHPDSAAFYPGYSLPFPGFTGQDIAIASEEGTALYRFDASGRHQSTEDTLTGHTSYGFDYDTTGLLLQITDLDGEVTHIRRDGSGHPTAIVAPDGQRTTLTVDPNGYLASVTHPGGERHTLEHTAAGLMTAFTDPNGHTDRFEYDDLGRLVKNTNADGGGWTLTHTKNAQGYTNAMTTAEGRTTTFEVDPLTTGDREQVNTYPDSAVQIKRFKTNSEETTTAPDGTITTLLEGPDPRFGMLSPVPSSVMTKLPSGLMVTLTTARQAALRDATGPLSLTGLTATRTLNGETFTAVYSAATRTWTSASAARRQSTRVLDDKGRTTLRQVPGLEAVQYAYDPRGRLTIVIQGSGTEARTTRIGYDAQGYVGMMTDALGRGLAPGDTYPAVLGRLIGREVINSGVPGENQRRGPVAPAGGTGQTPAQTGAPVPRRQDMLQRVNPKQTADNLEAMARMAKERGAAVVPIGVPDRRLFGGVADYCAEIAAALDLPYEGEVMNEVLRDPALKSDPVHANSAGLPPDWRAPGGVVEGRRCGLARQPNRHR